MATQQTFSFYETGSLGTATSSLPRDAPAPPSAAAPIRPSAAASAPRSLAPPAATSLAPPRPGVDSATPQLPSSQPPQRFPQGVSATPDSTSGSSSDSALLADPDSGVPKDRAAVLGRLRAEIGCVTVASTEPAEVISTGCAAIDDLLPQHGLRLDSLTEWVAETDANGAAALAIAAAVDHLNSPRGAGPLVVIDREGAFYPPAAVSLGIPAERIIWCRPSRHSDLVWSIDQALRCESVAAVFSHVGVPLDDRDARRFQLAAEAGRTPALFVRPAAARGKPTFAETRFHVAAERETDHSRAMRVTLERARGASRSQSVAVRIDDRGKIQPVSSTANPPSVHLPHSAEHQRHETVAMHLASQLADPASLRSAAQRRRRGA